MKSLILILSFLLIVSISKGQNPVTDTHPTATIFVINYQTNLEEPVNSDAAILFKDAFIDLVRATDEARMTARQVPGQKTITIKQENPKIGNGFQLTMQSNFGGRMSTVYSFVYDIDQNSLSFFDPSARNWRVVQVQGQNLNNLNDCAQYARFNDPNAGQAPDLSVSANGGGAPDLSTDNTDAMDASVTTNSAPPELPEYEQPECPADGDLWQPGYWAYSMPDHDYYWIPGVWVAPPTPGVLWTPPYWGYEGAVYIFHPGYWGPTVGFYGGINYGYGYVGVGFVGGEWHGSVFRYNTAVVRVNVAVVHNTYVNNTVVHTTVVNRVSFNGPGGITARPTPAEVTAMHQEHLKATVEQIRNQQAARVDRSQFAKANMGRPANFARPQAPAVVPNRGSNFSGRGAMQPQQRNQAAGNNFNQGQRNASPANSGAAPANQGNTRTSSFNGSRYYRPSDNGQSNNNQQQQRPQQQNNNQQQQRYSQPRNQQQQQQRSQQQNRSERPSRSDDSKRQ